MWVGSARVSEVVPLARGWLLQRGAVMANESTLYVKGIGSGRYLGLPNSLDGFLPRLDACGRCHFYQIGRLRDTTESVSKEAPHQR